MKLAVTLVALACTTGAALAKLPPLNDEAKAKAAEAAARAAHADKVGAYKLCQSMDKVAAYYVADAKKSGKEVKPAVATPPCADPGQFTYTPPEQKPQQSAESHSQPATAVGPPSGPKPADTGAVPAKKP
jgi:hypothetical protein